MAPIETICALPKIWQLTVVQLTVVQFALNSVRSLMSSMSRTVTHCTRSSDGDNSVRHFTKYRAAYFYLYKQYICLRHNATLDWCFVLWCEMALIECDTVLICVRWCEKFLLMFLQIYFWNDVVRAIICKLQKKKYHFIKAVLRTGTERGFLLQKGTCKSKTVLQ